MPVVGEPVGGQHVQCPAVVAHGAGGVGPAFAQLSIGEAETVLRQRPFSARAVTAVLGQRRLIMSDSLLQGRAASQPQLQRAKGYLAGGPLQPVLVAGDRRNSKVNVSDCRLYE